MTPSTSETPITCSEDHHAGTLISMGTRVHLVNTVWSRDWDRNPGSIFPPASQACGVENCQEMEAGPGHLSREGARGLRVSAAGTGTASPAPWSREKICGIRLNFSPRRLVWDERARSQTQRQDHEIRLCLSRLLGTSGILTIL